MESQLLREQKKIFRNLNGIRTMGNLPGAMVVVDVNREKNALFEARNLGIPTICLIDTDGDPDLADIPIPGNDDSMRSIDVIVRELCAAIAEGKAKRAQEAQERAEGGANEEEAASQGRRRSSRSQFRAEEDATAADTDSPAEPTAEAGVATETPGN